MSRSATKSWRDPEFERQAAERRSGIWHAGKHDIGEQRHRAGFAVNLPDRARPAIGDDRAEQTRHERRVRRTAARTVGHAVTIGVRHDNWQTVRRSRGRVDIRRVRVVERDRKDLTDLARGCREWLGHGNELPLRWSAHAAKPDHAQSRAVEVDIGPVEAPVFRWRRRTDDDRSRKASYRGIARWQDRICTLRISGGRQQQNAKCLREDKRIASDHGRPPQVVLATSS